MAISVKHNNEKRSLEAIKVLLNDKPRNLTEIKVKVNGVVRIIWEAITSTFLDKLGNPFCGSDGAYFMGKDE